MKRLLIICFLFQLAANTQADAQILSVNTDTLQWKVNQLTDVSADTVENFQCSFITYGGTRISWLQKQGTYVTEFTVTSIEGSWPDVAQDGLVKYHVSSYGKTGELTFLRESSGVSINMVFLENNINVLPFKFKVTDINSAP